VQVAKDTRKRVVGVLLGETYKGRCEPATVAYALMQLIRVYSNAVDITNSFAVPFEEDTKEPRIFFLDHDYLEAMCAIQCDDSYHGRIKRLAQV
jgi:26S proteasome regulatory subunit N8